MAIGTAGYTAILSMLALERIGVKPSDGEILMAGTSGGVGSIAIALLDRLGYRAVASIDKTSETDSLQVLGAREMIDRAEFSVPDKPSQKERWAVVVDSVGLHTLVNVYVQVHCGDVVTTCGLAQDMDFPAVAALFAPHSVTLYGIDNVMAPRTLRKITWQRLVADLLPGRLAAITREVTSSEAIDTVHGIMAGGMRGRVVVDVN